MNTKIPENSASASDTKSNFKTEFIVLLANNTTLNTRARNVLLDGIDFMLDMKSVDNFSKLRFISEKAVADNRLLFEGLMSIINKHNTLRLNQEADDYEN